MPVVVGGTVALLAFSIGLVLAPLSSEAGLLGFGLGLVAALALPSFLAIVLRARLSRAAVGELLVELREPLAPDALRDGLRRALGDPSLELLCVRPEDSAYVDAAGARVPLPGVTDVQTATPIRHQGSRSARSSTTARCGSARSCSTRSARRPASRSPTSARSPSVQRIEARNRALLDALPDRMFRVARDGTYLDVTSRRLTTGDRRHRRRRSERTFATSCPPSPPTPPSPASSTRSRPAT